MFGIAITDKGANVKLSIGQFIEDGEDFVTLKMLQHIQDGLFAWSQPTLLSVFKRDDIVCTLPANIFLKTKKLGNLQTRWCMEMYIVGAKDCIKGLFGKEAVIV